MEEEEEPELADDDLTIDVFNFPHTFFHLTLNRTKSFKHKQHDLVIHARNKRHHIVLFFMILRACWSIAAPITLI